MLNYSRTITAEEYYRLIKEKLKKYGKYRYEEHPLDYNAGQWQLLKIVPKEINARDKIILIRGSIHGDEIAGALALLNYFDNLFEQATNKDIKLILYPLGNPSGFEKGLRYNIDNDKGEGNNDFLRYLALDGKITEDPKVGEPVRWLISDDPSLKINLPLESKLTLDLVRQDPINQIEAAIDLHQDYLTPDLPPCAYHYAYGDISILTPIAKKISEVVPLLKHFDMNAGYHEQIDESGKVIPRPTGGGFLSDENGFIIRHDGSFSDYFYRMGVKISIASETSGATPIEKACLVNWIWLTETLNLIAP